MRLRFTLRAEPSPKNSATTVPHLISVQICGSETAYAFPDDRKSLDLHDKLFEISTAKMHAKELKPRWTLRAFNVTVPGEIAKLYFDDDENPVFMGKPLDEFQYSETASSIMSTQVKVGDQAIETPVPVKSLASITKNACIPKFGSKSVQMNADSWIHTFETECQRLLIERDRYWEVIRLFLEDNAEKWYNTTRLSTETQSWETWRESFLENFASRGLAAARYAFSYRYINGSLTTYAQTKLNLLVSYNPKMTDLDKMTVLALGLPRHLQDKINMSDVTTLGKMLSLINSFDSVRLPDDSSRPLNSSPFNTPRSSTPCPYCKRKGYERFHFEKDCFTKARDYRNKNNNYSNFSTNNNSKNNVTKAVHSFNLQDLKQEINDVQKNE